MGTRFEIVQTDAEQPFHARFIAANGETVWTSENYADKRDAQHAIDMVQINASISPVSEVDQRITTRPEEVPREDPITDDEDEGLL